MKRTRNNGGYTLVEVAVSGALLLLLSLMMARGFAVCGRLVLRDQKLRGTDEMLEEQIALENPPVTRERLTLEVGGYGSWDVEVDIYQIRKDDIEVSFQVLRKKKYE